jgi:hypothetical protein
MSGTPTGDIQGRVVGASDDPVADAAVMIGGGPDHPDIAALTDGEGRFSFRGLTPGAYTLLVNTGTTNADAEEVVVRAGESADVQVRVAE